MNPLQKSTYSVLEIIAKERSLSISIDGETEYNSFRIKLGEKIVDICRNGDILVIETDDNLKFYNSWPIDHILEHGIRSII